MCLQGVLASKGDTVDGVDDQTVDQLGVERQSVVRSL